MSETGVERAILLFLAAAVTIAIVGASLVYASRVWANKRTQLRLVVNLLALLSFVGVYILSLTILDWLVNRQVNGARRAGELYVTYYYVHPGPFAKLLPLFAMLAVWLGLAFIRRRWRKPQIAG